MHIHGCIYDRGLFNASVELSINQSVGEIFILQLSVFIASMALSALASLLCLRLSCKFDFGFDSDCMPHAAALHIQVLNADALYSVLIWLR